MRTRITVVALGTLIAVAVLYFSFQDRLPPRTAQKVARLVSDLSIPRNAEVRRFEDEWNNLNGDGFSQIELVLDDSSYAKVRRSAPANGYRSVSDPGASSDIESAMLAPVTEGLYRLQREPNDRGYAMTLLDDRAKKVYVMLVAK